ncbi:hypothetical protein [Paracidovorax oryzae]|uniref:hypothetical protein n=1 Tax=Paracidovorax oryzae TaxID=862720 RepID=UPI0002E346E7|nr:hypothetical protein [Paracidovorax oryzae]
MALTNLTVQSDNNAGPLYQQGWDFYATDLNQGAGGKYIYVGYQRGTANPITDVRFEAYDSAQQNSIPGWEWSPVDLNEGAGGKYIYMYWKRGGAAPITNLMFLALNESTPPRAARLPQLLEKSPQHGPVGQADGIGVRERRISGQGRCRAGDGGEDAGQCQCSAQRAGDA